MTRVVFFGILCLLDYITLHYSGERAWGGVVACAGSSVGLAVLVLTLYRGNTSWSNVMLPTRLTGTGTVLFVPHTIWRGCGGAVASCTVSPQTRI